MPNPSEYRSITTIVIESFRVMPYPNASRTQITLNECKYNKKVTCISRCTLM